MAFDFWKKKKENTWSPVKASPLGYWEEKSYMMAVPEVLPREILTQVKDRLGMIPGAILTGFNFDAETRKMTFTMFYEDEEYQGGIDIGDAPKLPSTPQTLQMFTQDELARLQNATHGLIVYMKFGKKPYDAYHLQLKILTTLVPDLIMIFDESAERNVNGRWAKMAAASKYTPGPKDLFQVQAVQGKDGKVWLHSHGLCRFNLAELEVLNTDVEHYQAHYNVLATLAGMMLDEGTTEKEGGFYIGMLADRIPVVATAVPWTEALAEYPGISMGGLEDRKDGHNSKTNVIFLYKSEEDQKNDVRSKLSIYDKLWEENPLFFFSNAETKRLSMVARERFDSAKKAFAKGCPVLIKIGLPVDNCEDGSEREHIWFELKSLEERGFIATLTQEPYNVSGIHTGDDRFLTVDDITDWVVMSEELRRQISPDLAYLLE
ncbi:MAG: DUF4026 domain-containing protein [Lachnospiraceae bacterium]|nr:DUF4026 domain-containing protein [Lachnospiraceae bacterium]